MIFQNNGDVQFNIWTINVFVDWNLSIILSNRIKCFAIDENSQDILSIVPLYFSSLASHHATNIQMYIHFFTCSFLSSFHFVFFCHSSKFVFVLNIFWIYQIYLFCYFFFSKIQLNDRKRERQRIFFSIILFSINFVLIL